MAPLNGYPASIGAQMASVFPHIGGASYTRVTVGPLANGDPVRVAEAGIRFFDFLFGGTSDSGQFVVEAIPVNPSTPAGGAEQTYTLRWIARVTATVGGQAQTAGSEAAASTDLSGQTVRLFAIGRY